MRMRAQRWTEVDDHIRRIIGKTRLRADFVLFDDVGQEYESASGWSNSQFNDVLRFRFNRGLPSILTSNLPVAEWAKRYSDSMASFLHEATTIVALTGEDFRRKGSGWNEAS